MSPNSRRTRSIRFELTGDALGAYQWILHEHPRTFFTSSYSGNLGYGYPFALGTKVARPDKAVVAACGDGGFMSGSRP
jgi:thiamine pyrophosphate-dependent acetolactate synthase large subunit-like protein